MKVKEDKISEQEKLDISIKAKDTSISLASYKKFLEEIIQKGTSPQAKKDEFKDKINQASTKDYASISAYNYILAGEGKKVGHSKSVNCIHS